MAFTKEDIIGALKTVFDPEIPVNIWDLGLIYDIAIEPDAVVLTMTFTSPTCPMMEDLLAQVKSSVEMVACQFGWNWSGIRHGICRACRTRRVWIWI